MIKERKKQVVEDLKGTLEDVRNLYLADISGLNASETSDLRRTCFNKKIKPGSTKCAGWGQIHELPGLVVRKISNLMIW